MIKAIFFILLLLTILFLIEMGSMAIDQTKMKEYVNATLNWLPYQQGLIKSEIENKPMVLYFYSENCAWCNRIEEEIFFNEKICEDLAKNYTLVRVEYNSPDIVNSDGKKIQVNQLLDFYQIEIIPSLCFLDSNNQIIEVIQGYISPEIFIEVLYFIREQYYKIFTFQEYYR